MITELVFLYRLHWKVDWLKSEKTINLLPENVLFCSFKIKNTDCILGCINRQSSTHDFIRNDFVGAFSCIRFDKLEWDWILILMEIYAKFDTSLEQKSTMDLV